MGCVQIPAKVCAVEICGRGKFHRTFSIQVERSCRLLCHCFFYGWRVLFYDTQVNFLAHVFLADHDPDAIVGQLCGDFVRGPVSPHFPQAIAGGIQVHRAVDSYTDKHPLNRRARRLFSSPHRRYAGIICDVVYDHFLAVDWHHYCDTPLADYVALVHQSLADRQDVLPDHLRDFMPYLQSEEILQRNTSRDHIDLTLRRIANRRASMAPLATASEPLWENESALKPLFDDCFPQLVAHARTLQSNVRSRQSSGAGSDV